MPSNWPHPACLPAETLLESCDLKRTRGGGPGGQHRNRVDTRVVIRHRPTGLGSEAGERRSQLMNRKVAIFRLRLKLAVEHREPVPFEAQPSALWRSRCRAGRIVLSREHDDFPAILAEVLDVLEADGWAAPATAKHFGCTTTQLVRFLRAAPAAITLLNAARRKAGKRPYR